MIFNQVEMEDIKLVKLYNRGERDFSNKELIRLQNENAILKRNLNPINISDKEVLYVWH
jgi:hypothetical protein